MLYDAIDTTTKYNNWVHRMHNPQKTNTQVHFSGCRAFRALRCCWGCSEVSHQSLTAAGVFCPPELHQESAGAPDGHGVLQQQQHRQHRHVHRDWLGLWDGLHGTADRLLAGVQALERTSNSTAPPLHTVWFKPLVPSNLYFHGFQFIFFYILFKNHL